MVLLLLYVHLCGKGNRKKILFLVARPPGNNIETALMVILLCTISKMSNAQGEDPLGVPKKGYIPL